LGCEKHSKGCFFANGEGQGSFVIQSLNVNLVMQRRQKVVSQQKLSKSPNQKECKLSSITMHERWYVDNMHSNLSINLLCVENLRIL